MLEIGVIGTGLPADERVRDRIAPLAARLGVGVWIAVVWTYAGEVLFEPDAERDRVRRVMSSLLEAWRTEHPELVSLVSLEVGPLAAVLRRMAARTELVAVPWEVFVSGCEIGRVAAEGLECSLLVA